MSSAGLTTLIEAAVSAARALGDAEILAEVEHCLRRVQALLQVRVTTQTATIIDKRTP